MTSPRGAVPWPSRWLNTHLSERHEAFAEWLAARYEKLRPAIHAGSDVRDGGYKAASVDANGFPAGFNNLCQASRAAASRAFAGWLDAHHPDAVRLLLLPENHTRNPYYLESVRHLLAILRGTGRDVCLAVADPAVAQVASVLETPTGHRVDYRVAKRANGGLEVDGRPMDLVLLNNDLSAGLPPLLSGLGVPVVPRPAMGWSQRTKGDHFRHYNSLAAEAARVLELDPFHLTLETRQVDGVDFKRRKGLERVAAAVDEVAAAVAAAHDRIRGELPPEAAATVPRRPFVFVKDASGTYGMGITVVATGEDVLTLNARERQRMGRGKGRPAITSVLVQEGVPTVERFEGHTAEPVVYTVGGTAIGAFLRYHKDKGAKENLNQPGMGFVPLCVHKDCTKERAKGASLPLQARIVAEIATLAASCEEADLRARDRGDAQRSREGMGGR